MLEREYRDQVCAIAGALEMIGERWTLLILRDVFNGVRRFDQLQRHLGIARNVLDARLRFLVEEGILEKRLYQERPERFEYRLSQKGIDLWPVLITLMQWGDKHRPKSEGGPPVVVEHRGCGGEIDDHLCCSSCGERLTPRDTVAKAGPGSPAGVTPSGAPA